jgi:predicted PurR-regulated permease PerM
MHRAVRLQLPWSTLLKVLAAIALIWVWRQLVWVVMLLLIALIVAVGLAPVVAWLERRGWSRGIAASAVVLVVVAALAGFLVLTWSSIAEQAGTVGTRFAEIEREVMQRLPQPLLDLIRGAGAKPDASALAPYATRIGRGLLQGAAAFVLAWILVVYLLIESAPTYRWIRGFVPERHRRRFDHTAAEAREVAFGFVVGNVVTSACAALYFFAWLTLLDVPAAALLALLAFVFDFIPVLGFYLSCLPAMAMAATVSGTLALAMIPIYLSYDFIENYLIAPRIYGDRLRLTKLAVLLAFAVGAQLGGIVGALLALPVAAVYPVIERHWLRGTFGGDVVDEHQRIEA